MATRDPNNLDEVTAIAYHEVVEEITNPETGVGVPNYTNAWFDSDPPPSPYSGDEIADLCEGAPPTALIGDWHPLQTDGAQPLPFMFRASRAWSNGAHKCVTSEPQLDDPLGVHVMAGYIASVPFMAGGTCLNGNCGAMGTDYNGRPALTITISPGAGLGLSNGTATISVPPNAATGAHEVIFGVTNNSSGMVSTGASIVTVDPCLLGYTNASDPTNCGGCGQSCPSPTGGHATCSNSQYGMACNNSGYSLCGTTCVDLSSDRNNCGACGYACTSLRSCIGGVPTCTNVTASCPRNYYWDDGICRCSQ